MFYLFPSWGFKSLWTIWNPADDGRLKTAARRRLNMALILALVFALASHLTQPASYSSTFSLLQVIYVLFISLMGFQIVVDDLEPNFLLSAHKVEPLLPF